MQITLFCPIRRIVETFCSFKKALPFILSIDHFLLFLNFLSNYATTRDSTIEKFTTVQKTAHYPLHILLL